MPPPFSSPPPSSSALEAFAPVRRSVLAWPAWLRVLVVLPALLLLWLAVGWAAVEIAPW